MSRFSRVRNTALSLIVGVGVSTGAQTPDKAAAPRRPRAQTRRVQRPLPTPLDILRSQDEIAVARVVTQLLLNDPSSAEQLKAFDPAHKTFVVSTEVRPEDSCGVLKTDAFQAAIDSAVLKPFAISRDSSPTSGLKLSLADLRCSIDTRKTGEEPITSTYVASYQQVANPTYVAIQSQLNQAMLELQDARIDAAQRPSFSSGFAKGMAEGAVERLRRQLQQTSPYLSRPVALPYTAYRYQTVRSTRITGTILLEEPSTGFADSLTIDNETSSTANGIRSALDTDTQGLRNSEPGLLAATTLLEQTAAKILHNTEVAADVRTLTQRYFFQRARAAVRAGLDVAALGDLLIASDLDPQASELVAYDSALAQARSLTLAQVPTLHLQGTAFASREGAAASPSTSSGRASALQNALKAVVTVKTGDSQGSGFFVTSDGYLVTNAHVLAGGERIIVQTGGGESFLARPIKVSEFDDLALLKTTGAIQNFMRLGDSDTVAVGTDVTAVGSPLGLSGTATRGIVSAVRKLKGTTLLQIDAAINPGNSGGPLLTDDGQVVGVTTLKLRLDAAESLGFAISSNDVKRVFAGLVK